MQGRMTVVAGSNEIVDDVLAGVTAECLMMNSEVFQRPQNWQRHLSRFSTRSRSAWYSESSSRIGAVFAKFSLIEFGVSPDPRRPASVFGEVIGRTCSPQT